MREREEGRWREIIGWERNSGERRQKFIFYLWTI
jgi:hypothetical protein